MLEGDVNGGAFPRFCESLFSSFAAKRESSQIPVVDTWHACHGDAADRATASDDRGRQRKGKAPESIFHLDHLSTLAVLDCAENQCFCGEKIAAREQKWRHRLTTTIKSWW